jgi:hypothetical protein
MEVIPAFSVVEIMFSAANQIGFDQGYGLQVLLSCWLADSGFWSF